jgi:DNA invertase Pin-like site-specific DNA recombinase
LRLDRFGRSLADLITTPSGKALAGMLAVFAEFERSILKERVKAGIAEARSKGKDHGRPTRLRIKKKQSKSCLPTGRD